MNRDFGSARGFYLVIILSTVTGMTLNWVGIGTIRAMWWANVINGVMVPFLLVAILLVAVDKRIVKDRPSSKLSRATVFVTIAVSFLVLAGLLIG